MPNRQSSTRDQNKIRNASDRVVVVAARKALNEYLKYSASQLLSAKGKRIREILRSVFFALICYNEKRNTAPTHANPIRSLVPA